MRVFVDQSAQDRFSEDLLCVYAGHGGARSVRFAADDTAIEYAELISRADTRVTYRYEYLPANARPDRR